MSIRKLLCEMLVATITGCSFMPVEAKIKLPSFFTDNMVLQQQSTIRLNGTALPKKNVNVYTGWDRKNHETVSDEKGEWSVNVQTPKAGGPYELTFSDGQKLTLKNILIGEVWFCSGQSNMEMPLGGWGQIINFQQEIAGADCPSIRLLQVSHTTALDPQTEATIDFGWAECNPSSVPNFSAAAYFFARKLWEELKVPIGLVHSSWGGTPGESWVSYDGLNKVNNYRSYAEKMSATLNGGYAGNDVFKRECRQWMNTLSPFDRGMKNGQAIWATTEFDDSKWNTMNMPGYWEQQGLEGFDGLVWFRKEVQIPNDYQGKTLELSLSKIDDDDIVYFNGVEIGMTIGANADRVYTIPGELVKRGMNLIVVRVLDTGGEGGFRGTPEELNIRCGKKQLVALAGKWKYNVGAEAKDLLGTYATRPQITALTPAVLYNAMVHPFIHFPVRGFIWYQGEGNEGRAYEYTDLFQALINDWRQKWNNLSLPFYFVQLAAFREKAVVNVNDKWPYVREAQSAALALAHTGMAVTIDIGDSKDIHPKNKQEVGRRLALCALKDTYGIQNIESSAPVYDTYRIEGDSIRILFKEKGDGFRKEIPLEGFSIAGTDHQFYPAEAYFDGDEIIVYSSRVVSPAAVRYGWADFPICNLFGKSGLPVSSFRTDKW